MPNGDPRPMSQMSVERMKDCLARLAIEYAPSLRENEPRRLLAVKLRRNLE